MSDIQPIRILEASQMSLPVIFNDLLSHFKDQSKNGTITTEFMDPFMNSPEEMQTLSEPINISTYKADIESLGTENILESSHLTIIKPITKIENQKEITNDRRSLLLLTTKLENGDKFHLALNREGLTWAWKTRIDDLRQTGQVENIDKEAALRVWRNILTWVSDSDDIRTAVNLAKIQEKS